MIPGPKPKDAAPFTRPHPSLGANTGVRQFFIAYYGLPKLVPTESTPELNDPLEGKGASANGLIRQHLQRSTSSPDAESARALHLLLAILDMAVDAVLVTDPSGRIIHMNERCLEMANLGGNISQHEDLEAWTAGFGQLFARGDGFRERVREILASPLDTLDQLELAGGGRYECSTRVLQIEGEDAGRVWTFRDISERYNADITAYRLAAIVKSSDDAIISKDLNSIIMSWNEGAERIFGYTAEEMIGTSIMRLIPENRQNEEEEILSRLRRGERIDHFETVRVTKSGRLIDISLTVSPIKDAAGVVVGASKVARDITVQKQYEAELKRAKEAAEIANRDREVLLVSEREARSQAERTSRMKDEFLATLSHELRTPLNAVLGWANVLRQGNPEPEDLRQGLEAIERNARAQNQIVEDLLEMSRIISGKVRLDVQRVDLSQVLEEAVETVRAAAEAKSIRLQAVIDPFPESISGDPGRLQQVFWNLLNNALKFTPKEGTVRVLLQRVNSHVEVSVSDTGEGIATEFLPYVFDRFQQADSSITRRHGGLGLGLAIVKQLVELHGGRVSAKSRGKGHGATFTVELPVMAVNHGHEPDRRHPRSHPNEAATYPEVSLSGVRVLVVDDEVDARQLVKRMLELSGAEVVMAGSAGEAMDKILAGPLDVVVCDIGMPDEDGFSFIRRVRQLQDERRHSIPAVALTAYARSEDRTKAIRSGFQNHLAKPVEVAELLAIVGSLAGQ